MNAEDVLAIQVMWYDIHCSSIMQSGVTHLGHMSAFGIAGTIETGYRCLGNNDEAYVWHNKALKHLESANKLLLGGR